MNVKIISVAKQLPKHSRETKDIIPFVKLWMQDCLLYTSDAADD